MSRYPSIQVSPNHYIGLNEDYLPMIERPPRSDFVVRTLAKRTAGDMPLMSADLVIASVETRDRFPLANEYPLHFRKTYFPGRLHADPRVEFKHHTLASTLIEVPAPIGHAHNTFRSCLLPGTPFNRLFELGVEPDERNIDIAQELELSAAAGLWLLAERALNTLMKLQDGGLCHNDAHWHNFIVCRAPLAIIPIDFERAVNRDSVEPEVWKKHCRADLHQLLRLGVYLQGALGRQRGPLGQQSLDRLDELVRPPDTFRRAIDGRTFGAT